MDINNLIAPSQVSGWDIALACLVLAATWLVYRFTARGVKAALSRITGMPPGLRNTIARITKYLVLFLGFGIALTFLGAQLQPVLTVVIIVVVILVLALRGIADNFSAGLVIQTRKPINIGDEVESQGYTGVVTEVNGRSVELRTSDGRMVHLPNAELLRQPLVNNSEAGVRRSEVQVRCGAPADTALLDCVAAMATAAGSAPGVHADPAPDGVLLTADPQRLTMTIRFWHEPLTYVRVTSAVVAAIGEELRRRGWPGTVTSQHPDAPLTPPEEL